MGLQDVEIAALSVRRLAAALRLERERERTADLKRAITAARLAAVLSPRGRLPPPAFYAPWTEDGGTGAASPAPRNQSPQEILQRWQALSALQRARR